MLKVRCPIPIGILLARLEASCGRYLSMWMWIYRPPITTSLMIYLQSTNLCPISRQLWCLMISTFTLTSVRLSTLLNSTQPSVH